MTGHTATNYRIGIDLGTNSLGWCAVELDGNGHPIRILDAGVRILTPNEEAAAIRSPRRRWLPADAMRAPCVGAATDSCSARSF